eukprot:601842-Pyramimonas_sp.AAC.1
MASSGHGPPQGSPRHAKIIPIPKAKTTMAAFPPFRAQWTSEASRWLQDGPRELQEGPKRAPRRSQKRPRAPQERPKRAPRDGCGSSRGATLLGPPPYIDRYPPIWPQENAQGLQNYPKRAPRGLHDGSKRARDDPKM